MGLRLGGGLGPLRLSIDSRGLRGGVRVGPLSYSAGGQRQRPSSFGSARTPEGVTLFAGCALAVLLAMVAPVQVKVLAFLLTVAAGIVAALLVARAQRRKREQLPPLDQR